MPLRVAHRRCGRRDARSKAVDGDGGSAAGVRPKRCGQLPVPEEAGTEDFDVDDEEPLDPESPDPLEPEPEPDVVEPESDEPDPEGEAPEPLAGTALDRPEPLPARESVR
jgi:hypothetical protein